jgi:hypothetical protein
MSTGDVPKYQLPSGVVAGLAFTTLCGGARSFRDDAVRCIERLKPPLQVFGREYIPVAGPLVITVNHYSRPGFGAWWIALAVAAAVPQEMHWVITGELLYLGKLLSPLSRWALARIARSYGFTSMPPMPPRPVEAEARARAVRQVLAIMKEDRKAVLGLAPEGMDHQGGRLAIPVPGAGRFALLLEGLGCAFLPVGAYEAEGAFCLRFGPAYRLHLPAEGSSREKGRAAARILMGKIAAQLPLALRGEFA